MYLLPIIKNPLETARKMKLDSHRSQFAPGQAPFVAHSRFDVYIYIFNEGSLSPTLLAPRARAEQQAMETEHPEMMSVEMRRVMISVMDWSKIDDTGWLDTWLMRRMVRDWDWDKDRHIDG